jgi:hypothetical protein
MAARGGKFTVTDAANRATTAEIPCTGEWSGTAEVNGPQLRNAVKSLSDKDIVMLYRDNGFLTVTGGASKSKLDRVRSACPGQVFRFPPVVTLAHPAASPI